jgi:hypothetical protein
MGAPEWFLDAPNGGNGSEPWTQQEKDAVRECVKTYKTKLRPLVRNADLYHVLPRPDGVNQDAIEYYDPACGKGVLCLFQPSTEAAAKPVRFRGLDGDRQYRLTFEDGTHPTTVKSGEELMKEGLQVVLQGAEVSELVFFEVVR